MTVTSLKYKSSTLRNNFFSPPLSGGREKYLFSGFFLLSFSKKLIISSKSQSFLHPFIIVKEEDDNDDDEEGKVSFSHFLLFFLFFHCKKSAGELFPAYSFSKPGGRKGKLTICSYHFTSSTLPPRKRINEYPEFLPDEASFPRFLPVLLL